MDLGFLTPDDKKLLQRIIAKVNGMSGNRLWEEEDSNTSENEAYIAHVPEEGLPGMSDDADVPHVECSIYKIVEGALEEIPGLVGEVYNPTSGDVDEGYIGIFRDKFGTWIPSGGGGGGSIMGKSDDEIPAMSGTTPGDGIMRVWRFVVTGTGSGSGTSAEDVDVEETGEDVVVFNLSSNVVAAATMLVCSRVLGRWVIIFEDCPG